VPRTLVRLRDAHRMLGTRNLLWVTPRWLVQQEFLVLVGDLRVPARELPPDRSVRWTTLTETDIPQVCGLHPAISEAGIRRRLEEGQECLLGWIDGSLAHYRWDTARSTYVRSFRRTFRLFEGDLLTTETFAHPSFRGRGLHSRSTGMVLRRARDRGLRRSITFVAWWNAPSLRSNHKAGRTIVGTLGRWTIGPWRPCFATGDVHLDQRGDIWVCPSGT
jgi:hypothetical protein